MPIITISRGFCSGGAELAKLLHERLGWPVLSQEDVSTAAAKAYRMSEEELLRGLYLPANLYERFTHRKTRYLLASQAKITELLAEGNGIYHGLGGQFLLQELCNAFKVRIVAPMAQRMVKSRWPMMGIDLNIPPGRKVSLMEAEMRIHWPVTHSEAFEHR
mgnify:CR=1 FL=1